MMFGVGAIALSSAAGKEQRQWQEAARRESLRYDIALDFVEARMQGMHLTGETKLPHTRWDWILVILATTVFVTFALMARAPLMAFHWVPAIFLVAATLALLLTCGIALWRTTHFN
jgi:hypothetical protein